MEVTRPRGMISFSCSPTAFRIEEAQNSVFVYSRRVHMISTPGHGNIGTPRPWLIKPILQVPYICTKALAPAAPPPTSCKVQLLDDSERMDLHRNLYGETLGSVNSKTCGSLRLLLPLDQQFRVDITNQSANRNHLSCHSCQRRLSSRSAATRLK